MRLRIILLDLALLLLLASSGVQPVPWPAGAPVLAFGPGSQGGLTSGPGAQSGGNYDVQWNVIGGSASGSLTWSTYWTRNTSPQKAAPASDRPWLTT